MNGKLEHRNFSGVWTLSEALISDADFMRGNPMQCNAMQFSEISLNWERHLTKVIDSRVKNVLMVAYLEDSFNSSFSDVFLISYFSTAEIGGQVGLCVGASLLTVLEFCDVMLAIIGIRLGFR